MKKYLMDWKEVYERLNKIPNRTCYGIPRGGAIVAGLTGNAVDSPEKAEILVDDIIDSGKTAEVFSKKYNKPVYVLITKEETSDWIVFPWEESGEIDIQSHIVRVLEYIGEDPNREGLKDTPKRMVKSWEKLFGGYDKDPVEILKRTFGSEKYDEMVFLKDIEFYSTCEHHFLPFFGRITIAYIPKNTVVGISKLARLVEIFARRLQIQERLTTQIADTMNLVLQPLGVGVYCEAQHFCMTSRGVEKQNSKMITNCLFGVIKEDARAREEFMSLVRK